MTEPGADPGRRHRLDALVLVVQSELAAAGLPVAPAERPIGTAGAIVSVDLPDLNGVLVHWRRHEVCRDAAQAAWAEDPHGEGDEYAAFSRLSSAVGEAMGEAMRKILTAAGLEVTPTLNDYEPHELLVTRSLAPSPWRARHDARFRERYESMRRAWNSRLAAERPDDDGDVRGEQ
ncbi:hypothetical protein [Amycolatopsis australiensis]|uniref:Uncharacterized protein n=1 Tax=Amycolatopsis australiensis TaxID=546364 RepID=A0A1K1S4M1_9PSEU|nr:hypothetical protein [Amycolatopsis australiensis]SFW79278.1 hypothetical protein SAMN04489730_4698 [Amycolatopsis australiensis]